MQVMSLKGVSKSYGELCALSNLSLDVTGGEVLCLLGPNGAGKSTTLNLMLGLIKPDCGSIEILGHKPHSNAAHSQIGYVAQDNDFPDNLTAREVIELVASHFANPAPTDELIATFGLDQLAERYTGGFSGGERHRLALALAFAGNAKLIFLDEPTTGLDKEARLRFWQHAKQYVRQGGTLVVTTHHLEEVEDIASRVCLIAHGVIRLQGNIEHIKQQLGQKLLSFTCEKLPLLSPVTKHQYIDGVHRITSPDADEIVCQLVTSAVPFVGLEIAGLSLEQAIDILLDQEAVSS